VSERTVLVVDDEADIRESLRDILEDEGYRVRLAANGQEALAQLRVLQRPCAVILDIMMPVMNGAELYAAMKADPSLADLPLVISTSDPTQAPRGSLIMKKPLDVGRLLRTLAKMF